MIYILKYAAGRTNSNSIKEPLPVVDWMKFALKISEGTVKIPRELQFELINRYVATPFGFSKEEKFE